MKKLIMFGLSAATALSMTGGALMPMAGALTIAEIQAQIAALTAQIAAMGGENVTATTCYVWSGSLTIGSRGPDVTTLQNYLTGTGHFTFSGGATGYFGPVTQGAVAAWQAANGVAPAVGYFGPISQAKYMSLCSAALPVEDEDETPADGDLGSGDGDITDINETSSADSNIVEGETNEIFAFDFKVEGDVEIDRVDFYLDSTEAGAQSENADDYFQSAILVVDGEEVATLDVEDFDEDSYGVVGSVTGDADEYRIRFTSLGLVYEDGDEPEFALAFEVNSSIDTADLTETWAVELENDSIRFIDGKGFSSEEGNTLEETFGADTEETGELDISASTEDPEPYVIEVSASDESDGDDVVFVFDIEEQNGVDVTIEDLTLTVTTTESDGTASNEDDAINEIYLLRDGTEIASESVPDGGVVNFEDLGLALDADDTAEMSVQLMFNPLDGTPATYDEGTTVTVAFTSIDNAEDANGNDEGDMAIAGTPTGETHEVRTEGIRVEFVDSTSSKTSSSTVGVNETVEFELEFKVTAFGDDMWIDQTCAVDDDGTYAVDVLSVSLDGDADGNNTTCTDFTSTGDEGTDGFEVQEGDTETFTVSILGNGGEAGGAGLPVTFKARINAISYNVGTDLAGDTTYELDLANYKSSAVTVYDR